MTGDVLQLISILGHSTGTLEQRVGFHAGRLAQGFNLWVLNDTVYLNDFEWGGTTDLPGNWFPSGEDFAGADAAMNFARVEDIKRWQIAKAAGANFEHGDYAFDLWKGHQASLLNDRSPSGRIVKIEPRIPHDPSMPSWKQYPKAQGSSVKQWKLRAPKCFVFSAFVAPGSRYLGGGSGDAVVAAAAR
jgi:hypothetical protein